MKKRQPLKVLAAGVVLASGIFVSTPMDSGVQAAWESPYNFIPHSYKGNINTFDELIQLAVDAYNSPKHQPVMVVLDSKKNFEEQISDYFQSEKYLQDMPDFGFYGRTVNIYDDGEVRKGIYEYHIQVYNDYDEKGMLSFKKKMDKAEKYIVDNYPLNTDYEVVFAINDFIADNFSYGMVIHDDSHPYVGELQGGFTCGPYTKLAQQFYNRFGIESRMMTGGAYWSGEAHAWNAVKVGGNWYYSDATAYDSAGKAMKNILMTEDVGYTHWGTNLNTNTRYEITKFRATNVKFEKSMAKPYNYKEVKKAQAQAQKK